MSIEDPAANAAPTPAEQAPSDIPAAPPASAPAPPSSPQRGAAPVIVGAIVAVMLIIGGYALWQNRSLFAPTHNASAYVVQPYTPPSQLISAHDHVVAYERPDTASPGVVMFGPGVALTITGRVSRGFADDWYAITWSGHTAFIHQQDATPGNATAPPPTAPRVAPLPPRPPKPAEPDEILESDASAPPPMTGPFELTNPNWIRRPNAHDVARYYPRRALDDDRSGRVVLDCTANSTGLLDCSVASEDPLGYQFGAAALSIARGLRVASTLPDGRSVAGGHVRVPLTFRSN